MTDAEGANHPITPDLGMIATFAKVLFDYSEGWVAVRAFPEKGDASQPARTPFVAADAELPTKLVAEAEAAAKKGLALYVVAGTVSGPGKAKAGDVIAIEAVLVDLDHGDVSAKREHLVKHLGPPSLEVASGRSAAGVSAVRSNCARRRAGGRRNRDLRCVAQTYRWFRRTGYNYDAVRPSAYS